MGDLSKHFSKKEFACKDGCGFDTPSKELLDALEELRGVLGRKLIISSGCRCASHNAMVRGSPKSQHLQGTAADVIIPEGISSEAIAYAASTVKAFSEGGIGQYKGKNIIHVDVRKNGPARWNL